MQTHGESKISGNRNADRIFSLVIAPVILLVIAVAFFGDVLFLPGDGVLSKEGEDLFREFVHYRDFGFSALKKGDLAFWNPYIFSGTPFFSGFQSALLYPLHFIYLILPLAKAINLEIVLHVFLAGLSMYCWTFYRGLHPYACLFSAVLLMFCGPYFLHIYPGHLSNLCSMAWAPLILLAVDGLVDKRSFGWCLFGMFAVAMQLLAGHPQYVFYTGVTATIYVVFSLVGKEQKLRIALGFLGIYGGAVALTCVQLIPGIEAGSESIRGMGVPYEFAAQFSFAPENLATIIAPGFFGNLESVKYWGRHNFWEMNLFISVTGFVLAIVGAVYANRDQRRYSICMVLILIVLALGAYTPLFRLLYSYVPGFNKFRGNSKFIFFVSLYLIMLAGLGFDALIKGRKIHRAIIISCLCGSLVLAGLAIMIWHSAGEINGGVWGKILLAVDETGESPWAAEIFMQSIKEAGIYASKWVFVSSGILALLAGIFLLAKMSKKMVYLFVFIAMAELLIFSSGFRPEFQLQDTKSRDLIKLKTITEESDRILSVVNPNSTISLKMNNIWGEDPGVLDRYARFMAYTQGRDPDKATQYVNFSRPQKLYNMLRCRYIDVYDKKKKQLLEYKDILPVALLIDSYRLIQDRDQIFKGLTSREFDPRTTVILETRPDPEPVKSMEKGSVKVIQKSTDEMVIEADLSSPKILLITDSYSKGWRARAIPESSQKEYEVMPANYILRAIPLRAGHHLLSLEYVPQGFEIGKWISIISGAMYLLVLSWYIWQHRKNALRAKK